MKEITVKIKLQEGDYNRHGENIVDTILEGIKNFIEIDLEHDSIIKPNWEVTVVGVDIK